MLSPECRLANPDQIGTVSTELHGLVMGLALSEQFPYQNGDFRSAVVSWHLPLDNEAGVVEVQRNARPTELTAEPKLNFFNDVTLTKPTSKDKANLLDYGLFNLNHRLESGDAVLSPATPGGNLTVEDLLASVGVTTANDFKQWVLESIPKATMAKISHRARLVGKDRRTNVRAALEVVEQAGTTVTTRGLDVVDTELLDFKSILGDTGLQAYDYMDVRNYIGPFDIPYDDLLLVSDPEYTLRIIRSSRIYPDNGGMADMDRRILTVGRLKELHRVGLAVIHFATGHLAGATARRIGGPVPLKFDTEAATQGYEAGLDHTA
jgi:hypothetical protein